MGYIGKLIKLCAEHNLAKLPIHMDLISNPYAPGAGSPPPELAGRGDIRHDVEIRLNKGHLNKRKSMYV